MAAVGLGARGGRRAGALSLEFAIDIAPAHRKARMVVKSMRDSRPEYIHDEVRVVVAAG